MKYEQNENRHFMRIVMLNTRQVVFYSCSGDGVGLGGGVEPLAHFAPQTLFGE